MVQGTALSWWRAGSTGCVGSEPPEAPDGSSTGGRPHGCPRRDLDSHNEQVRSFLGQTHRGTFPPTEEWAGATGATGPPGGPILLSSHPAESRALPSTQCISMGTAREPRARRYVPSISMAPITMAPTCSEKHRLKTEHTREGGKIHFSAVTFHSCC